MKTTCCHLKYVTLFFTEISYERGKKNKKQLFIFNQMKYNILYPMLHDEHAFLTDGDNNG